MKLTVEDKKILREFGHKENKELKQIERAISKTTFTVFTRGKCDEKEISLIDALELLDRKEFLSGIGRSAFHWSSVRDTKDGRCVYFDSSRFFK